MRDYKLEEKTQLTFPLSNIEILSALSIRDSNLQIWNMSMPTTERRFIQVYAVPSSLLTMHKDSLICISFLWFIEL